MALRLNAKAGQQRGVLTSFFIFIFSVSSAPALSEMRSATIERQIATYHPSTATPSPQRSRTDPEARVRAHVTEAGRVLVELQAFIEEATEAVTLSDQLKANERG